MVSVPVNIPRIVPTMRRDVVFPQHDKASFHLLSAESIDSNDVDAYCRAAEAFEAGRTRTRIGFEAAVAALGATAIGVDDMSASRSNARTGETLEDCAAVVSRFSD